MKKETIHFLYNNCQVCYPYKLALENCTEDKNKVTCKNCKRTKIFKEKENKQEYKEVVNVKTQEEWDEVIKFYNIIWNYLDCWQGENTCIRYNPDNKFSSKYGSGTTKIAYKEDYKILTFEEWKNKYKLKEQSKMKYKIGDKVKVRSWNDMEKEFGLNEYGNINNKYPTFVKQMRQFCGEIVTIYKIFSDSYSIEEDYNFSWTDEMFEDIEDNKKQIENKSNIVNNNVYFYYLRNKEKTKIYGTVCFTVNEDNTINRGVAYCNPHDKFNKKIGRQIAYGRMLRKNITSLPLIENLNYKKPFMFDNYIKTEPTEFEKKMIG